MSDPNPQCEDGYTRIANELLEALCRTRISGESMQIFWTILRKTYGYGKKVDRIALSQFTTMTGMKKPAVVRALRNLHGMNFIIKIDNGKNASYGINKKYQEWEPLSKRTTTFQPLSTLKKFCYICNFDKAIEKHHIVPRAEGGSNKSSNLIMLCPNCHTLVHKKALSSEVLIIKKANVESVINEDNVLLTEPDEKPKKPLSKTVHTKDKQPTKDNYTKDNLLPCCAAWRAFVDMRKKIKKPLTDYAAGLVVNKLIAFHAKGHDPTTVLNLAVENGWQSVYEPKGAANGRQGNTGSTAQTGRKAGIIEANRPETDWLGS